MNTVLDIENWISSYLGRSTISDLNPSNGGPFNPSGINMDLGMIAINSARRIAERAHDFMYSDTNVFLSISSTGGSITTAFQNSTVAVTGTLSPNVTGTWTLGGIYNGLPFYLIIVSSTYYFLWYTGTAWFITASGFTVSPTNYWSLTTNSANPAGAYTASGSNTGSPVVANSPGVVGIKRIKYVSLPIGNGQYEPIEFLTNDQFVTRQRIQIGRQTFDATKILTNLGIASLGGPLAYQQGQTIFISGTNITLPIVAQLAVVQWMPNYTSTSQSDYFTTYGTEFLQWQGLLEVNKIFKRFVERQEGNIDEAAVQAEASAALQTLIDWDVSTVRGSSTPNQQNGPAPALAASQPSQQAA
jgi:hypothetical protein